MTKKYKTILIDPPWPQSTIGEYKKHTCRQRLPYSTMTLEEIQKLPIEKFADIGCHLWLWTTNEFLEQGFRLLRGWGFTYLAPITWVKPSGESHIIRSSPAKGDQMYSMICITIAMLAMIAAMIAQIIAFREIRKLSSLRASRRSNTKDSS